MTTPADATQGGLGPYCADYYALLGLNEYRQRYPEETAKLSDEQIWNVVSLTEDDQDDAGWKALFSAAVGA